jgi:ubiquinone/menaquinone biosynthesis C-methylase UbiE
MRFSPKELIDNHARLVERNAFYRRYGYDVEKNAAFVLSQALPLSGRVLEIGTGKGRFLTALIRQASRVTTIDIDAQEQRFARLNVAFARPPGKARFVIANAASLPWRNGTFDAVVSMNALHHITDVPAVVDEAIRVAKPTGKIVLADFSNKGFAIMEKIHRHEGRTHVHTRYGFRNLVESFAVRGWRAVLRSRDCEDVLIATRKAVGTRKKGNGA